MVIFDSSVSLPEGNPYLPESSSEKKLGNLKGLDGPELFFFSLEDVSLSSRKI